jgi:inner membrane protein
LELAGKIEAMDSVSQVALGAAVAVAVMGRRTQPWKAAVWGGLCGTMPDLDAFVEHADPILTMTLHRAESHAVAWLTVASAFLAPVIARLGGNMSWRALGRWWLATWLTLITHPLLDTMTVYGTRIALPFSREPYGVGSIFIIDPLYTLPLLVGVIAALISPRGLRWNRAGLLISTLYVAWSFVAQQYVTAIAREAIQAQSISAQRVLVTPTAFNTILWRVLVMTPDAYYEGFHSLLDFDRELPLDRFERRSALYEPIRESDRVMRVAEFSRGFFAMSETDGRVVMHDLRMGQEPNYSFSFLVARHADDAIAPVAPEQLLVDRDAGRTLRWIWRRMQGERLPPPRDDAAPPSSAALAP